MCEREATNPLIVYSHSQTSKVEEAKRNFITEATRLQKLGINHRNIVGINEVFEANDTVYYVMEYIDGLSLSEYIKRNGALSETETRKLLSPVLSALKTLHNAQTTHLDIKPANIMLQRSEHGEIRPVLIDFGLAKHYNTDGTPTTTFNLIACSHGFAPAEQYAGIPTFSPLADLYALAATAMCCLTGTVPPKAFDITDQVIRTELNGHASYTCIDAICNAMRFDRSHRDPKKFSHWLEGVENNERTDYPHSGSTHTEPYTMNNDNLSGDHDNDYTFMQQVNEMIETEDYQRAYDMCLESYRLEENKEYYRMKMDELRTILRKKNNNNGRKLMVLYTIVIIGLLSLLVGIYFLIYLYNH